MRTAPLAIVRPARVPVVRPAALADVPQLETLIAPYVATGDLLPRSNYDLCRHIKEYVVAEAPDGAIVGCGSLKVYSQELGEIAGLAVHADVRDHMFDSDLLGEKKTTHNIEAHVGLTIFF